MKKEIVRIKLNKIIPNKNQPRLDFYDDSIKGLAESIKQNGLLQPVTVRKNGDKYELIAGERRYRASLLNGASDIEAIIMESSDEESANLALIENLQREDLNAIEQAMAMRRIMSSEGLTQNELAKRLGYRQSTVANKLRLLKLPEYIKQAISHGTITERHARALLNVPEDKLEEVYLTITNRQYNVSKTEEYIRELTQTHHSKGVSNNLKIGVNTIKEAYELCKKSGIDADLKVTEYDDNVKIVIRMKK
ncbi:MAG: ParB/RepB/Spo0J family partition protein [Erysipelotrichaceae bacterium]|jgi:ParB family chromosome partitioning protein|nr:ParB/RepB/Spo0J family partition protein [Erysipelotrichaceae bacterium]MBQ1287273.1 ParB/RepB/Spo0J family partition protein [Erysipelotrichaceae bacterium]MBQ1324314.1 ParB/RepB/Spo0J family partition protein [Erysipelotrichaceae bacterium]MBQ1379483.1 ParB/RepB/Spo0J family partition protein [Erysipelotrichaceae bacterium]MBQ1624839.1 ParB/RepB/Spo0J family partition protein [Erysipelotrichaceae bacterium]